MLSIVTSQPVFAETTQLKQWIAPPECVIEGDILTPEECDQLLDPTPPTTNLPTESPATDTRPKPTAPYWELSSLLIPSSTTSPSPVDGAGVSIADRSETRSPSVEDSVAGVIILGLILIGAGLIVFTGRRTIG